MPHPRIRRVQVTALTLALGVGSITAADNRSAGDRVKERVLRMTEFFDTMLPGVLEEHNMTLHVHPKFSDLRDSEYMRFPFELRYGLTDHWELQGGLVPF